MRLFHTHPHQRVSFLAPLLLPTLVISTPTTIFTLPGTLPNSWFENLAVRPNGKILATRGDAPEIWQIDPVTSTGALLVSVSGAYNLTGITQVNFSPGGGPPHTRPLETYIFSSSHIPAPLVVTPGSAKVWKLTFSFPSGSPAVSLLAAMPSAGFLNGATAWGENAVLLSDTEAEAVYLLNATTGNYTTPLTGLPGINGIRTAGGYLYRANHLALTLSRIPIAAGTAAPTGPEEVLVRGQLIDDFAVRGGKVYLASMYENSVVEAVLATGIKRLVQGDLTGTGVGLCTVVVEDRGALFAAVGQGGAAGGSARIVRIDPE